MTPPPPGSQRHPSPGPPISYTISAEEQGGRGGGWRWNGGKRRKTEGWGEEGRGEGGKGRGDGKGNGAGVRGMEEEAVRDAAGEPYLVSVAPSGLEMQKGRERVRRARLSAGCSPLGCWVAVSPVQEARGGLWSPVASAPAPSPSRSFKQRGQPGKTCCERQPASSREGAQVTTAPGNRSPGNRWQLQERRHCLAPTQHSPGPPNSSSTQVPRLGAGRKGGVGTARRGEHLPVYVCQH